MPMKKKISQPEYLLGIMSGTSADGINIAIIRETDAKLIYFCERPMPQELREPILRLAEPGLNEIDSCGALDQTLGQAFAEAALHAIHEAGITPSDIIAIGSHGQTIRHRPKGINGGKPFTLQVGCAANIAEHTGITTISDFRKRDIAAGGEGAPLVPFAHHILFGSPDHPTAVLNIGGIANITYLYKDADHEAITGFDTGPGNMLMDALMLAMSDGRNAYDKDGQLAASGTIDNPLLNTLLDHLYLKRLPPKSTGRETFGNQMLDKIMAWPDLSDADRMATITEFTARSIAESCQFLPEQPESWYICGGGAYNSHLMSRLENLLNPATVKNTADIGISPEAMEAVCFALLAKNTLQGLPNTIPEVTGAARAVTGGQITPGNNWPNVLEKIQAWTRSHMP